MAGEVFIYASIPVKIKLALSILSLRKNQNDVSSLNFEAFDQGVKVLQFF
jgi:hypothetical protein